MNAMLHLTHTENDGLGEHHPPAPALFAEKCIAGLNAGKGHAVDRLAHSSTLATVFVPEPGQAKVSERVKRVVADTLPFIDLACESGSIVRTEFMVALVQPPPIYKGLLRTRAHAEIFDFLSRPQRAYRS